MDADLTMTPARSADAAPDAAPLGILPCQAIEGLIAQGAVTASTPFDVDQVQPASLDLRLGARVWRVRASFLPGLGRTVRERIADVAMHEIDLAKGGAVLERGCVYIAELQERLKLPRGVSGRANPKSSTGRVDVFVRCLTDRSAAFDDVAEGYDGPLYMEIAPQTFSVLVRPGTRLNQMRFKSGASPVLGVRSVGVDLTGDVAGFRARRHAPVVDLDHIEGHDPRDFWQPLEPRRGELLLDPGFGTEEAHGGGSKGVLEVRSHETPFLLEDGQTVARLVYEPLTARPVRLYGQNGSHYQRQGLKLSKHFQPW